MKIKIFFRELLLLALLIVATCVAMIAFEILLNRHQHLQQGREKTLFLAQQLSNLLLWDDRVASRDLLDQMLVADPLIRYAFVERDGAPYVYTFPTGLFGRYSTPNTAPVSERVQTDAEGRAFYDIAVRIGHANAIVHLGLDRRRVDRTALWSALWIAAIGGAFFLLMIYPALRVAGAITREIEIMIGRLRESEEKFRTVADFTYEWEYWLGVDRRMLYVSPSCERISGFPPASFYADPQFIDTIIHPDDRQTFEKHAESYHLGNNIGESSEIEFRIVDKNGCTKWINHVCTPVTGDKGIYMGRRASNHDISKRKSAEAELRRQSGDLEAANNELEAFSYSVAHDLRAPLRGIEGFSRALLEEYGNKLDDTGKTYLERVCKATQKMGFLIDDLLQLSRVIKSEFHCAPVDLSHMVRVMADTNQEKYSEGTVDVAVQEGIVVQGDPCLLEIAMENLLDNAWKFSCKVCQPRIEFGTTVGEGKTIYFIRDNGAGFDMAYVDKLFGPFQRLHTTKEFTGTGIGLATVQRIIHRHGGQVWAEGEVGKGATFYFTLPL